MSKEQHAAPAGPGDFQEMLKRLQQEFAGQLPARLQEARLRLDACLAAPGEDGLLRELHRVLHKLAGSAGTFGMAGVSDQAQDIEDLLLALLARGGRSASDFAQVARRLELMLQGAPTA
jgi:HPt (histidine-containing phosphotransfer) domain-containing protein